MQVQNAERIVKSGNDSEQPEALAAEGVGKRKAVTEGSETVTNMRKNKSKMMKTEKK